MKALKTCAFLLAFLCSGAFTQAQSDASKPTRQALLFADSLVQAFRNNNWNEYLSLSYPGVVRYYGGKEGFREYVQRARTINSGIIEEIPEKIEVVQMANNIKEWQCVVKKTRQTIIEGRKAIIISYMVGQSKDEGRNWKYFDVAYNSAENVVYIMPDIFNTLTIPQRQIIFIKDQLAKQP